MAQQHFETGTPAFSENLIRKWSGKWKRSKKKEEKNPLNPVKLQIFIH